MKKVTINLYELSELSEYARNKAIEEHRTFKLRTIQPSDFISGEPEYDTPEKLNAARNLEYDYLLENDEPVIEDIEANEYLFYASGKLANCITYRGEHEKAGIIELKIGNDTYTLQPIQPTK